MQTITYGSVCSGIEAASVAWEPLGWRPRWFSEIEPFPSAVLAHHWPGVMNVGDMTALAENPRIVNSDIDVLVGGTPCQAFSVAGDRRSLDDARGNLTLKFVELVHAIGHRGVRCAVWENVPGVLNTKDNAFGCFLGGMVGADAPLVSPYKRGRWPHAGLVSGPKRAAAWVVRDAQYFGLAQRRRRVFLVSFRAGDGLDPAEVLFEPESLRRDTAPRREAGEGVAGTIAGGSRKAGGYSTDDVPLAFGGNNQSGPIDVATAVNAHGGPHGRLDFESETFIAFSCKDHGADAGELAPTLRAMGHGASHPNAGGQVAVAFHPRQDPISGDVCMPLEAKGPHAVAVSLRGREGGGTAELSGEVATALRASQGGGDKPHVLCATGEITHALKADGFDGGEDGTGRDQPIVPDGLAVRRLTVKECERLQGFPDDHTLVQYRGKPAANGPRYKAIGNSMAVPVMAWLGRRIDKVLRDSDVASVVQSKPSCPTGEPA